MLAGSATRARRRTSCAGGRRTYGWSNLSTRATNVAIPANLHGAVKGGNDHLVRKGRAGLGKDNDASGDEGRDDLRNGTSESEEPDEVKVDLRLSGVLVEGVDGNRTGVRTDELEERSGREVRRIDVRISAEEGAPGNVRTGDLTDADSDVLNVLEEGATGLSAKAGDLGEEEGLEIKGGRRDDVSEAVLPRKGGETGKVEGRDGSQRPEELLDRASGREGAAAVGCEDAADETGEEDEKGEDMDKRH